MTRRNGTDLRRTDLKKDLKKLGIAAAALFAASGALWFGISKWEDSKYQTEGGESSVYVEPVITEARTVEINGVTYEQKQNVETYLMMGIDIAGPVEKAEQAWGGGQADVQMLVVLDNKAKTERVTIDTGLRFHNCMSGLDKSLDQVVIIELKRDGNQPSPLLAMLRDLHIHPYGFSKYCMGTALSNPSVKKNRLKPKLHYVERLLREV